MNYYLVSKILLFSDENLVQAKNSRKALEQVFNPKYYNIVYSKRYYDPSNVSVTLSNDKGYTYRDRRRVVFYQVDKKLGTTKENSIKAS